MTLGQRIAQKRKEAALSQEALGDALGVSRQAIYKWESDASVPEIEKLIAMSRLFGVSVGWLLGVEEEPTPETDEGGGELNETQLKMVEEIVARYIQAQPKTPPAFSPRRRRVFKLCIAAAAVCLALGLWSMSRQLEDMRQSYITLQNDISRVESSVASQVGGISNRVEEILKAQNDLTADYSTELLRVNVKDNRVLFTVYAVPKTYVEGMTVQFSISNGDGGTNFSPGEPGLAGKFSATLATGLSDSIVISAIFTAPDGTRQTQILQEYSGFYTSTLPSVMIDDYFLMWASLTDGQLIQTDGYVTVSEGEGPVAPATYEGLEAAAVREIRVGLFRNGQLVQWAEPCDQPKSFQGFDGQQFYVFRDISLAVSATDRIACAAVVTDEYGRDSVAATPDYVIDDDGKTLTWAHDALRGDSQWVY